MLIHFFLRHIYRQQDEALLEAFAPYPPEDLSSPLLSREDHYDASILLWTSSSICTCEEVMMFVCLLACLLI